VLFRSDPAYRGATTITPAQAREALAAGHAAGWPMCAHVTGDAGVDFVLEALEAVGPAVRDRRFTFIHAYFPNPVAIRRVAALGACVSTQPAWYYRDADAIADALGEARMRPFIGLADWVRAGVRVAINSDHMFGLDPDTALNPYNPFLTMGTAVTRKTQSGRVIGPEQRVSREDALRMMTVNAASLTFEEERKGSIEVGKLGDLAVLSGDFLACDADRIRDLRARATVVGGRVVHERTA
jgi:predicted amidohydrolase YtcJ